MTDDEIIAVVKAHKEGKRIQSRHLEDDIWMNNPSEFQWNFGVYEYRVAPEPPERCPECGRYIKHILELGGTVEH